MDKIKSIIFDFDGTLHDTMKIYYPAFSSGVNLLRENGYAKEFEISKDNIEKFLGEKPNYAYDLIAKNAPKDLIEKVMNHVGSSMEDNMSTTGELYPHTVEVLEALYKDYDLYILSNCRIRYLEKALNIYEIRNYFKNYYTAEAFNYIPKENILNNVRKNIKEEILFVGDRYHDILAAADNKIKSVFARYGFGNDEEGKDANYKINSIDELLKIL